MLPCSLGLHHFGMHTGTYQIAPKKLCDRKDSVFVLNSKHWVAILFAVDDMIQPNNQIGCAIFNTT
jgi:hypothetical protein